MSEAAVDEGGPRREYFRLVLGELANNNALFDGGFQRRILRQNLIELEGSSYLLAGCIMALSLIYGGPPPHFLARAIAEYFLGITRYTVSIEDVPEYCVHQNCVHQKLLRVYIRLLVIGRAGASPPSRATGAQILYIYVRATV